MAISLDDLGRAHARLGHTQQALSLLRESLALFRQISYDISVAETLRDLGDTLLATGDPVQARAAWKEALNISQTLQTASNDELISRLNTHHS